MGVIIITGASKGVGKQLAYRLKEKQLLLVARNENELKQVVNEINSSGGNASYYRADLTNEKELEQLVHHINHEYPAVKALINNAGAGRYGDFQTFSWQEINFEIKLNLTVPMLLTSGIYQKLKQQKEGAVINLLSDVAIKPVPGMAAYSAAKTGLKAFTEALRGEMEDTDVQIINIYPGIMNTGFHVQPLDESGKKAAIQPRDVAEVIYNALYQYDSFNQSDIVLSPRWNRKI